MQSMILVSVRDKKAEAFHPPYAVPTRGIAIRAFGDAVLKGGSDLSAHPEDFDLFLVGEFDQISGKIQVVSPVSICSGLDFRKDENNEN